MTGLAEAVARYYYKLLAYKDEYEVARLFTDGRFVRQIEDLFEGDYRLTFHMASPLFSRPELGSGRLKKVPFGSLLWRVMKLLAGLRPLRGTLFDVFGYSREERRLIASYEADIEMILGALNREDHAIAVEIVRLPDHIRGYGPVKAKHVEEAEARWSHLLDAFKHPCAAATAAE